VRVLLSFVGGTGHAEPMVPFAPAAGRHRQGADQMHNADRVKALGVGRALHPVTTTAAEIRDTVAALLTDDEAPVGGATYAARDLRTSRPRQCTHLLETEARHSSKPGDATDDGDRRRS
jgi:hypothetical protein